MYASQGVNQCAVAYLIIFFVVLTVDFMVLNCFYYINVRGDPSLAGKFDMNVADATGDKFLWPIIVTIVLLVFYYAQYMMAFSMGCNRLQDKSMPKARKVGFVTGVVVHFSFIFCALFGVFNRHFANGGIQLLAYTVLNLYVYLLVILNWPVRMYRKEYELDEEEEHLQGPTASGAAANALHNDQVDIEDRPRGAQNRDYGARPEYDSGLQPLSASPEVKRFRPE